MRTISYKIYLVAALFVGAVQVEAKSSASEYYQQLVKKAPYESSWKTHFPQVSQKTQESMAKVMDTQESQRKVASELDKEFFEKQMSEPMKKFRDAFLQVNTPEELEALLVQAEKNYNNYPKDLKFIVAQVLPLRALRGLVWRLIPTVKKTKAAHSILLTQIKNFGVNIDLLLPTPQWKAGFAYLTQPFVENGEAPFIRKGLIVEQFAIGSEVDIQSYIRYAIIPALRTAAARLEIIDVSSSLYVWDNKFLYGSGSFPSVIDRYALFGEAERHVALSNIYLALSELNFQSGYSAQGALELSQDMARIYGFDGFFSKIDGVPAKKRIELIRKSKFTNYGLLFQDGAQWTTDALDFLSRGIEHGELAWKVLQKRPISEMYMMNNSYGLAFQRPVTYRFNNLKRLTEGPVKVHSFITDEAVTVNLKEYYTNPPKDLKQLYATQFEGGSEMLKMTLTEGKEAKDKEYRNYLHGRAAGWNLNLYRPYFPEIKSNEDLKRTARVLTQGWGTFALAMPLLGYLN